MAEKRRTAVSDVTLLSRYLLILLPSRVCLYDACRSLRWLNKNKKHKKNKTTKRRESGEAMRRLIAEEEERKRLRKEEEEAARIAQEKAKQEMEERQRRELEERRRALAKKKADLEEKHRQLEVTFKLWCMVFYVPRLAKRPICSMIDRCRS